MTVCCAAGMLMYQHASSVYVVLKMQDLVTKAKRPSLLPTKNSHAHNMCQQCFTFITLSPVSRLPHHAPSINTHILHNETFMLAVRKVKTETYKLLVHAAKPRTQSRASPCQQTSCFILFDTSRSDITSHTLPSDTVVFRGGCTILERQKDANQMQPYKM
jgi:hypothetical protein